MDSALILYILLGAGPALLLCVRKFSGLGTVFLMIFFPSWMILALYDRVVSQRQLHVMNLIGNLYVSITLLLITVAL